MKFKIKKQIEVETTAKLVIDNGHLFFTIGTWDIFVLHNDGTGYVCEGIPKNNQEGLQVDEKGRLVLSND